MRGQRANQPVLTGFNGAALDATAVCAALIGLVWAASRFLPPDLAERLRWALLPSVAVVVN